MLFASALLLSAPCQAVGRDLIVTHAVVLLGDYPRENLPGLRLAVRKAERRNGRSLVIQQKCLRPKPRPVCLYILHALRDRPAPCLQRIQPGGSSLRHQLPDQLAVIRSGQVGFSAPSVCWLSLSVGFWPSSSFSSRSTHLVPEASAADSSRSASVLETRPACWASWTITPLIWS